MLRLRCIASECRASLVVCCKPLRAFSFFVLIGLVVTSLACVSIRGSNSSSPGLGNNPGAANNPGPGSGNGGVSPPTTTLQAETGNNTSAANSFPGQSNGNAGPGNVSKVPITALLYSGANTKVFVHYMPWFGSSSHINVGYRSDDPAQVKSQVEDMMSRGIQGAIVDWFGPASTLADASAKLVMKQAEAHAGFNFAVMEDSGALTAAAEHNGCDVTAQLISDLNNINATFASSPAYLKVNGKTPIFMFGVTGWYIDWQRVQAALPATDVLLFRGGEGLQLGPSGGAFQWVDINSSDPFDEQIGAQEAFYNAASQKPNLITLGSAYKGFNDTLAEWSTNREIDQRCGQTWLDTFAAVARHYSSRISGPRYKSSHGTTTKRAAPLSRASTTVCISCPRFRGTL